MVTSQATEKLFPKFCCVESKQQIFKLFLLFSFFFTDEEQWVSKWGETVFFLFSVQTVVLTWADISKKEY